MTANTLLLQMQADLLGIEVLRPRMPEATALGAAFAAGLAVGFWSSPNDVREITERTSGHDRFKPMLSPGQRSWEHARWKDAVDRTLDLEKWGARYERRPDDDDRREDELVTPCPTANASRR